MDFLVNKNTWNLNYKMENFETLFAWAQTDFLTKTRISQLRNHFSNLDLAWKNANEKDFIKAGITERSATSFFERKEKLNLNKDKEIFDKIGAKLIFIEDDNYPQKLLEIAAPPIFLFVLGEIKPEDDLAFSVVGSRNITTNGKQAIASFVPHLVNAGFTIISGLARGVDAMAHKQCLDSGGRTIAVLGSGIDNIWPSENRTLAHNIINNNGAVISEFPIGTEPFAFNFPRRNRIVSGFSLGVLIVEGKEKSGSLITAQIALEQNREVFAVPGSPFLPLSKGPNLLIKKGEAKLVQNADDILEEFSLKQELSESEVRRTLPGNDKEKAILNALCNEPKMFDDIVKVLDMNSAEISSTLTILEMKGYVRNLGMGQWIAVV